MLKPLCIFAISLMLWSPQCGTTGPAPLKQADSLPPITCDVPYVGQLVTGGVPPYHFQITRITWNDADATTWLPGIGFKSADGKDLIIPQVGVEFQTNGYIAGTIPCNSSIFTSNPNGLTLNLAGTKIEVKRKTS